jgi:chitinase
MIETLIKKGVQEDRKQLINSINPAATPRIICYHQTHYHDEKFVSILPLLTKKTGVTHVIIAAIHLNEPAGNITLNDDPYTSSKNDVLWQEIRMLQSEGVKVLSMLGGAHPGSFTVLDGDTKSFNTYYEPLRQMLVWTGLDGLDLDVEEEMSLPGIIRLIDRLKSDFGQDFLITLAPVATAMQNTLHLSGFSYEELEKASGNKIAWYNTQFYCGWGCMETADDYEKILGRCWPPNKIVVGLVTNPENGIGWVPDEILCKTLITLMKKYPDFGGVMGWEYFNSTTATEPYGTPWSWAHLMTETLHSSHSNGDGVENDASKGGEDKIK